MEEQCLAWRVKDDKDGLVRYQSEFLNGQKFYLPFRCPETRSVNSELCNECKGKKEGDKGKTLAQRKQNHPGRYWGIITDPHESILSVAQFPFTESWLKKKDSLGISDKSMGKADTAIKKAKGVAAAEEKPTVVAEEVKPVVEKKKPRIKTTEAKPEVKKKVPRKNVIEEVLPLPKATALLQQSETESVEEVIMVKVQRFEHNGKSYYLNTTKYKLYDYQPDGGCKGIYHGRWDPETETIHTELADSDAEA
jgi:hypothetical protein